MNGTRSARWFSLAWRYWGFSSCSNSLWRTSVDWLLIVSIATVIICYVAWQITNE